MVSGLMMSVPIVKSSPPPPKSMSPAPITGGAFKATPPPTVSLPPLPPAVVITALTRIASLPSITTSPPTRSLLSTLPVISMSPPACENVIRAPGVDTPPIVKVPLYTLLTLISAIP